LFSFVEDNGLSLSTVLDAFRAPPLLLDAATSANDMNDVFHLAMCFDDLAVLLELVSLAANFAASCRRALSPA
jgi:hypothetical protein